MIKNKIFRRLAFLISLVMLLTSTANTTFGLIVTKTDSLINTFTPFERAVSNLVIYKTVEHPFGEGYVIPENISFDFKVDFGSLYGNAMIKTSKGTLVADQSGTVTVCVDPEKPFVVEGIETGTKVTVTELQNDGSGFTVKDGVFSKEGTIAENGSLQFDYINVYTPASVKPVNVEVRGMKILEGRDWQKGDTFTFELEQKIDENTWVSLGTKTVSYDEKNPEFNRFDFTDLIQSLTFNKVGTYHFRMTEVAGNLENVVYDKSINTFAIKVTDVDMDGTLEINTVTAGQNATVQENQGKYTVFVPFNNTFIPTTPTPTPEDIEVEIQVNKTVKAIGTETFAPKGFEFILQETATEEKFLQKTDKDGKALFTLPFRSSDVGKTYTYKLSEVDGGVSGVTYDKTVYHISVSIALGENNQLIAKVLLNGTQVDNVVAEFENTYQKSSPEIPPTRDNADIGFWFAMMLVSGTVCAVLLLLDRKYAREK